MRRYKLAFVTESGAKLYESEPMTYLGVMWHMVKLSFALRKKRRQENFCIVFKNAEPTPLTESSRS